MRVIKDIPVINRDICDQTQTCLAEPFPVHYILREYGGLEFLFRLEVEDLDSSALGLEGDDVPVPMHDGIVGVDGSADDFIVVLQVDDDNLGLVVFG